MKLNDARFYIKSWLKNRHVVISDTGEVTTNTSKSLIELLDTLVLDYESDIQGHNMLAPKGQKVRPLSNRLLEAALREHVSDYVIERRRMALDSIIYDPNITKCLVTEFLTILLGSEPSSADILVLKQWLWQVKRKALGLPVEYHIMPIFYSNVQGSGKSESLKRLCGPLFSYAMETTVADMSDSRTYFQLQTNLIGFVNEMQGCARADIESVKRIITADFVDVRRLGTNTKTKIQQNCSFIGTSNRHISEILIDSQMRRFYQYAVANSFSHDAINSINYYDLWKSIDENRTTAYTRDCIEELKEVQKDYGQEDYHLQFLREHNMLVPNQDEEFSFASIPDVYQTYCDWCASTGNKALSSNWMSIKFKTHGQRSLIKPNEQEKSTTYFKVKPDAKVKISIPKGFSKVNNRKLEVI